MTAPLFYVDSVPGTGTVSIGGAQSRHAVSAMRLQPGEVVLVGDGAGTIAKCAVVTSDRRSGLTLDVVSTATEPAPRQITVVQAIPKGERAELAVELLTETGVSRIVPWMSQRTVADWRGKEQAKVDRWRRVAAAAAMQARRAHRPVVADPRTGVPEIDGTTLVLHEEATACLFDGPVPSSPVSVVVGPEGGLSDDEVVTLTERGATPVNLGTLIMRTSTAGAAACVWLRGFERRGET
jgi:16S rRNA (uracil1498-N3)-methyltransferase